MGDIDWNALVEGGPAVVALVVAGVVLVAVVGLIPTILKALQNNTEAITKLTAKLTGDQRVHEEQLDAQTRQLDRIERKVDSVHEIVLKGGV